MKINQQSKPVEELYIQVWRNPIFYGRLLSILGPERWQTLTALSVFMNDKGECNPSLSKLKEILGPKSIASISRRVKSLESARFNGYPLIEVIRGQKKFIRGKWKYANNNYRINQQIVTIFATRNAVSIYSRLQAEIGSKNKANCREPFAVNEKRCEDNITKDSI